MNEAIADTVRRVVHDNHVEEVRQALQPFFGYLVWLFLAAVLYSICHSVIKDWVGGVVWRIGSQFKRLDLIMLVEYEKIGCMEYVGFIGSVITVYIFDAEGHVVGGWSLPILNNELRKMKIAKFKPQVDIPDTLRKAVGRPS